MLLDELKENPNNPRTVTAGHFENLKKSIRQFPDMLKVRPIVYDENKVVLGGNTKLKALKQLVAEEEFEVKDEYFADASGWSEDKKREFVIKDNTHYGDFDMDMIANEWSDLPLNDWGLDTIDFEGEKSDQPSPRLDKKNVEFEATTEIECPSCGHIFEK